MHMTIANHFGYGNILTAPPGGRWRHLYHIGQWEQTFTQRITCDSTVITHIYIVISYMISRIYFLPCLMWNDLFRAPWWPVGTTYIVVNGNCQTLHHNIIALIFQLHIFLHSGVSYDLLGIFSTVLDGGMTFSEPPGGRQHLTYVVVNGSHWTFTHKLPVTLLTIYMFLHSVFKDGLSEYGFYSAGWRNDLFRAPWWSDNTTYI